MDDEYTAGFTEPCAQCSAVAWGVSDEGRFFCRNCHNVIERTREVVDSSFVPGLNQISYISQGPKSKTEKGRQWMVCEGFQFILRNQAEALVKLGVAQRFKDDVLCRLWRLYLQKTHQAYTATPVRSCSFRVRGLESDSESAPDSVVSSGDTDGETYASSTAGSVASTGSIGERSDWSLGSGSVDSDAYLSVKKKRRSKGLMTMKKTLALLHVALVWSRQDLTLSDLLRLVDQGHVPFVNSYQDFPEEMKLSNRDALIFRVQTVPSYAVVYREAQELIHFLQLPAFPPISSQSSLHPVMLSLRYLIELNLPDELYEWVESLLDRANLMKPECFTFDPVSCPKLPQYELLAAAAIIVTMKFLFGLDDQTEWDLSSAGASSSASETGSVFSVRRWYRLLQSALLRAQDRKQQRTARKQWLPKKPFYFTKKEKAVVMKRRRVAEQLRSCFERLSCHRDSDPQRDGPCSFHFLWGQSPDADGPSLHHMTLEGGARINLTNHTKYWHPPLRRCRRCKSHYSSVEPTLPRMFVWILQLFSFLLDVAPSSLYEEVLNVERRVLGSRMPRTPHKPKRRRKSTTTEKTGQTI